MDFLNKFDKQQVQKITLIVIAALTVLALVLLLVIIIASINPTTSFGISDGFTSLTDYEVTEKDMSTGSLLVVNSKTDKYTIPSYEDLGLISLKDYRTSQTPEGTDIPYSISGSVDLNEKAAENLHKMIIDMLDAKGFYDAKVEAGFRSEDSQAKINPNTVGHSDHHTGMLFAFNFDPAGEDSAEDKAAQIAWLNENAHKYGIVLRYDNSKSDITGVSNYTNAYRYVGVAHAAYIKSNDICLEEYVEYLKQNTNSDKNLEIKLDASTYKVYYVSCEAGDTIKVPKDAEYTISGTNEGGVVVTVKVK